MIITIIVALGVIILFLLFILMELQTLVILLRKISKQNKGTIAERIKDVSELFKN